MPSPQEQLKALLTDSGYSITKPRLALFKALQHSEPQTISQIIKRLPSIDRASIYRNIELFQKLGVIQQLHVGWKYKIELSDIFADHHHHVSCRNCGRMVSFEESDVIKRELDRLAKQLSFEPLDHQLEIQGICSQCQKT